MISEKKMQWIGFYAFILSLLLHLFFLASLGWQKNLFKVQQTEKPPGLEIPAYLASTNSSLLPTMADKKSKLTSTQEGIDISSKQSSNNHSTAQTSLGRANPNEEPLHLIGDKHVKKPLLTLVGKAMTRHLIYPKSAADFNVKGMTQVGFMLYPDGHVNRVQLIRSSHSQVLDEAAMNAAKAISPVANVSQYLTSPQFIVIGIIFR